MQNLLLKKVFWQRQQLYAGVYKDSTVFVLAKSTTTYNHVQTKSITKGV